MKGIGPSIVNIRSPGARYAAECRSATLSTQSRSLSADLPTPASAVLRSCATLFVQCVIDGVRIAFGS